MKKSDAIVSRKLTLTLTIVPIRSGADVLEAGDTHYEEDEKIESELESYLAGFCSHCDKPREGKLCGCAFPCSLTFKVLMKKIQMNCQISLKQ